MCRALLQELKNRFPLWLLCRSAILGLLVSNLLMATAYLVRADVILQEPNTDFLVVEAEDADSIEIGLPEEDYIIVTVDNPIESPQGELILPPDTNASGQAAIYDQRFGASFDTTAIWKLKFETPGMYSLYIHYSLFEQSGNFEYGNEDSFYMAADFDEFPRISGLSTLNGRGASYGDGVFEGQFHWQRANIGGGGTARYEVTQDRVGQELEFLISNREHGSALDAMIFSLDTRLRDDDLDALLFGNSPELQAGDADQDLDFDQLDLVKVQIAANYLTGKPATWGEGDWNGAPGGSQGSPPVGDGLFDQQDIVAALQAGVYLTGPYAALAGPGASGDDQTTIVYDLGTGEVSVDAPAGKELTSINITSEKGLFRGDKPAVLDGAFDNFTADNLFKATFGGSFGSISFGNVLPAGLREAEITADLSVVGSLAGGGGLGEVDCLCLPEPATWMLAAVALGLLVARRRFFRLAAVHRPRHACFTRPNPD